MYSNGKITAPVSVNDVQRAIGSSSADVGTLCTSTWINKWAKFKPVSYAKLAPLTANERKSISQGLTLTDSDITRDQTSVTGGNIQEAAYFDWSYEKPIGGINSPYRLTDFCDPQVQGNGYYHQAVPPIQINYPRNGWRFVKGVSGQKLNIYLETDPDDSSVNLQAVDFVSGTINLNEWRLAVYVDSNYFTSKVFTSNGTILANNVENATYIGINIPSNTVGTFTADVYICLYRINGNRYDFIGLPKKDGFNPARMQLQVVDDAKESGAGFDGDPAALTQMSYSLNGTYRNLSDFTDFGEATYALRSTTGNLYVKMELTNGSGSTKILQRNEFFLTFDYVGMAPQRMFVSTTSGTSVDNVNIAAGETKTIYLEFEAIMAQSPYWNSSTKNQNWSFDLKRSNAYLVGSDMYAFKGSSNGWQER